MKKKNYKLKKAEFGVQKVDVPPAGSGSDVAQSALAGASAGATFGPWGAAIGAVGGTVVGFIGKGKKDRLNREALARNKYQEQMSKYTGGNQYQSDQILKDGSKSMKSYKPIEIEGGEPVFTKSKGKFKLKYLSEDGPSHEEGGIKFKAEDGDVIFPKDQMSTVMKKYKSRDHKGLEKMRQDLPEDKPQVARHGYNGDPEVPLTVQNINRYRQPVGRLRKNRLFLTPTSTKPLELGMLTTPVEQTTFRGKYKSNTPTTPKVDMKSVTPGKSVKSSDPGYLKTDKVKGKFDVNSGVALANTAYNLVKGMSPSENTPRNYVKLDRLKYQDSSDQDRLASTQARDINRYNRQNYGGGSSANLQAGLAQDSADDFYRKQSINQKERGIALNVQNGNVGIQSEEEKINKSTMDQADYYDAQNRAARNSFLQTGINDLSTQAQQNLLDKDSRASDDQRFDLANSMYQNYQVNRKDGKIGVDYYKRKGSKSIKGYKVKGGNCK